MEITKMIKNIFYILVMLSSIVFAQERQPIKELFDNNKIYIGINNKKTNRYLGFISVDHGVITSGYEGSARSCFIYKTEKIDKFMVDFYVQYTGFSYDDTKEFKFCDWVFPMLQSDSYK